MKESLTGFRKAVAMASLLSSVNLERRQFMVSVIGLIVNGMRKDKPISFGKTLRFI